MQPVTRFAPSPTGQLHLGHAFSALKAFDFAAGRGGRFLLRIEDIDGTRSRPEHIAGIFEDLAWLGLTWEEPVWFQSLRLEAYQAALEGLKARGLLYPCFCTRAEIAAEVAASASAPHGEEGPLYPGTCRRLGEAERVRLLAETPHAWRLDMGAALAAAEKSSPGRGGGPLAEGEGWRGGATTLDDHFRRHDGARGEPPPPRRSASRSPSPQVGRILQWTDHGQLITAHPELFGDVVLARKDAPASYHLAVTIDDAAQGVSDIIRGQDLFAATHVHRLLQALLGLGTPRYHHHKLIAGPDGQRLAKRHGAPSIAAFRAGGGDPAELVAGLRAGTLPSGFSAAGA